MTERAKYWASQVAAWERSGLTQAEYCRHRGIKAGNFVWWKRQLLEPKRSTRMPFLVVMEHFSSCVRDLY